MNATIRLGELKESGDHAGETCLYRWVEVVVNGGIILSDWFSGLTPGEDALACAKARGLLG